MIRLTLSHMMKRKENRADFIWRRSVKYEIIAGMMKGGMVEICCLSGWFFNQNDVINREKEQTCFMPRRYSV